MTAPAPRPDGKHLNLGLLDFPTAWTIQGDGGLMHADRCSSVPGWHPLSGPALLCDCGAVEKRWHELRVAAGRVSAEQGVDDA